VNRIKLSELPLTTRKAVATALELPTEKIVKVGGIKLIGFGEQTTRKALGTLQVLIEKNVRRAKDPQSFVTGLRVQLQALKQTKPKTPIGRFRKNRRVKVLQDSIKLLTSKKFQKLLESKVPTITKQYPVLAKINVSKLKKVKISAKIKRKPKTIKKPSKRRPIKRKM